MNDNGSSSEIGCSNSSDCSNPTGGRTKLRLRCVLPCASFCNRTPSCPNLSATPDNGRRARSANVRMPQSANVSRSSAARFSSIAANEQSSFLIDKLPSCESSSPGAMRLMPLNDRAAWIAASGFGATATLVLRRRCLLREKISFAMFTADSTSADSEPSLAPPNKRSCPETSSTTVSIVVCSTSGENVKARSARIEFSPVSAAESRALETPRP